MVTVLLYIVMIVFALIAIYGIKMMLDVPSQMRDTMDELERYNAEYQHIMQFGTHEQKMEAMMIQQQRTLNNIGMGVALGNISRIMRR